MAKIKTKRVDSIHVRSQILEEASKVIMPPPHLVLREEDKPYWIDITKARLDWTDIDLVHAYNLARIMSDIQKLQKSIDQEGFIGVGANGQQIIHPNVKILDTLIAKSISLSSKIQVHAAATIGEVENNKKKNSAKQRAIKNLEEIEDEDSLIAQPSMN